MQLYIRSLVEYAYSDLYGVCDSVREKEDLGFKEWGERLNKFLEYIAFLTQPDFIVLGGGVSKKFDKYASKLTLNTKVVPAKTLNLAGIIGAAMYAKTRIQFTNQVLKN